MTTSAYSIFESAGSGKRKFLLPLVDPDKTSDENAARIGRTAEEAGIPAILIGGSLLTDGHLDGCIRAIKSRFGGKVLLFPGNTMQLSSVADGILFLSLISGRNPELLIGRHVVAAPYIKNAGLEVVPTGYILVDGGRQTSVSYMSHTFPVPHDKPDIAACTAMAGEMLGLRCIYLDAGSGAAKAVSPEMIRRVADSIEVPLIVGGGIRTVADAQAATEAGAGLVVVGNVLEKSPGLLKEIAAAIQHG